MSALGWLVLAGLTTPGLMPVGRQQLAGVSSVLGTTPRVASIGVNLEANTDWERANMFVDVIKSARGFWDTSTFTAEGWPVGDFRLYAISASNCVFESGVCNSYGSRDKTIAGTYSLSFSGQATVAAAGGAVQNLFYNSTTGKTTAQVVVPTSSHDLIFYFTNTNNQPITDIKLIRPGYSANTTQTFTNEFLAGLAPFKVIRLMDYLATNWCHENPDPNLAWYCDTNERLVHFGPTLEWSERTPRDKPIQVGEAGGSIEYLVELANIADKDLWLNIPHLASEDYVRGLATYLKNNLEPERKVYLEFSNEVWNFGSFYQGEAIKQEALALVAAGNTLLDDPAGNEYEYARRLTIKKIADISLIFRQIFGEAAMMTRVRPIYADQVAWYAQLAGALDWLYKSYPEAPDYYLYGVAGAPYYGAGGTTVDNIMAGLPAHINSRLGAELNAGDTRYAYYYTIAQAYGLANLAYEGGIDLGQGTSNLANKIAVSYDARLTDVTAGYLRQWFACGGDEFVYFGLSSTFNQYGQWGLTDDLLRDYQTPSQMSPKLAGAQQVAADDARTFECAPIGGNFYAQTTEGVVGGGDGLTGTYYLDGNFTNVAKTQVNPLINFIWSNFGTGNPYPDTGYNGFVRVFSAKWTGQIMPKFSGLYTIGVEAEADDTVSLMVNGQALGRDGQINLTAGQRYDITITYQANSSGGRARLWWELPGSQVRALVPQSQLYSSDEINTDTTPPATAAHPTPGTYTTAQSISFTRSESGATYYCLGTNCTPTITYTNPLTISNSAVIRYRSIDLEGNQEAIQIATYTITTTGLTANSATEVSAGGGGGGGSSDTGDLSIATLKAKIIELQKILLSLLHLLLQRLLSQAVVT